jgi:hypothetical protein
MIFLYIKSQNDYAVLKNADVSRIKLKDFTAEARRGAEFAEKNMGKAGKRKGRSSSALFPFCLRFFSANSADLRASAVKSFNGG